MSRPVPNRGILDIAPYTPGKSPVPEPGRKVFKLSANETPFGPSPKAMAAYRDAAAYLGAITTGRLPAEQLETVTRDSALEEELFLGLRQLDGIDVGRIERQYGVSLAERFEGLQSAGLIMRDGEVVRLAPARLSVSNEVFVELMK